MAYFHGVEPKKPNNATELFFAIANDDREKVKSMVEGGLFLRNTMNQDEQLAIHVAAQQGNFPLFAYFLEADPSLADVKDKHGRLALHIAAKRGDLDMMKHLVNVYKMDVRHPKNRLNEKTTPIHIAVEEGHLHIVKWYIEEVKPFKPDFRNEEGETLMMSAAQKAHVPIVKYLLEYGYANPFLLDNYDANILFHSAAIGDLTVPKYLLEEHRVKFNVNWKNMFGITVTYMATRFNKLNVIKYFVEERNATLDIANNFGSTPLHEAAENGNLEIVKYLIEHKAGFGREDLHGDTPAKVTKNKQVAEYLAGVAKQRKEEYEEYQRKRRGPRSVSELFVQRAPHPQTPIPCRWIQKRINDQFSSAANQVVDNSAASRMVDTSLQLDSFLMLAGACAKYATGVVAGSEPAKHRSLLSPRELLREREDPIAFDAIDAMYDFEYPLMNDDD